MTIHQPLASRRHFLQGSAGLVLAVALPSVGRAEGAAPKPVTLTPNAFVVIGADDTVTILSKHIEMGQGPWTGLATLVAEELDADWAQIRVKNAPGDPKLYANLLFGAQLTGGSTAIANSYMQMRRTGAAARAMLVKAAAAAWNVPEGEIKVANGRISHAASGKTSGFGAFAEAAAKQPVPQDVKLKDPKNFRLIGTNLHKPDTVAKSTGAIQFTQDIHDADMVVAVVAHPPRFGGKAQSIDDSDAKAIKGYLGHAIVPQGVAIYAQSTWPAISARNALKIVWDESGAFKKSTRQIETDYRALAEKPGKIAKARGDAAGKLGSAGEVIDQTFVFPYLAHAPMEPLDAVVHFDGQSAKCHFASQGPTIDQFAIAKTLGVAPDKVKIDVAPAGGSFGRRATAGGDFAIEAASVAKAYGKPVPVKLVWTREDDIRGGFYRPFYVHRVRASVAPDGKIAGWRHTIVGQSIMAGTPFEKGMVKDGIDSTSVEGAADLAYAIADFQCDLHTTQQGVPVLWWRSVGHTHTAFSTETMIDMLLEKAGKDPIDGRLALLDEKSREAGVLRAVKDLSKWKGRRDGDKGYGVAMHKSFNTYVAQVAEVVKGEDGAPRVTRVWCAVDCGVAVNPNIIRAQMESGVGYGLGHALYAAIELDDDGRVVQSNFDTYRSLRIAEMPAVEVTIVKSEAAPTGVGEPGTPPIAPAVANGWRALTGVMATRLPLGKGGLA